MGKTSWRETFGTTGVKFRSKILSPCQNSRIWPIWWHHVQNDRIGILGSGAAKRGKKSWGETLRTTGVKFRSEILSPGQNLSLVFLTCDHGSNFQNFDLVRLRTFRPIVPKVFLQDVLPILGAPWPKITNRFFWPTCYQMVLLTSVRPKPGFGPFDHRATISLSWYFILVLLTNGATNGGWKYWYYPYYRYCIDTVLFWYW